MLHAFLRIVVCVQSKRTLQQLFALIVCLFPFEIDDRDAPMVHSETNKYPTPKHRVLLIEN